jgi:hypothetical protein
MTCVASCSPEIKSYVLKHCRRCAVDCSRRASTSNVDKSLLILALILSIRCLLAYRHEVYYRERHTGEMESTILQFSDCAFWIKYLSWVYSLASLSTSFARSVSSVLASRASALPKASNRRCSRSSKAYHQSDHPHLRPAGRRRTFSSLNSALWSNFS